VAQGLSFQPDEIGPWSEIKLDIVRKYASAYSRILSAKPNLYHIYIDAFAGAGIHISRRTGEFVPGSPVNALWVNPCFREYHFIDLDAKKVAELRGVAGDRQDICIYEGDCNPILLDTVFPRAQYEDYRRALCLLDPYGLHLNWEVIETAGRMKSIDLFLNFPVLDMNRNVLWSRPEDVPTGQIERMNHFWGDESWRDAAYTEEQDLFDKLLKKEPTEAVVEVFRARLGSVAGFDYVPKPLAMRNSVGTILYYLFFASQKPVAQKIVGDIFRKHGGRGME